MLCRLDLIVDGADDAFGVDHDRDAIGVSCVVVGSSAARHAERFVGVAQQRVWEAALLAERAVVCDRVERDAADDGALGVELGLQITEALALDGSTRGVGFWVEPEHQRLAGEVAQRARVALVVVHQEVWRQGACFEHSTRIGRLGADVIARRCAALLPCASISGAFVSRPGGVGRCRSRPALPPAIRVRSARRARGSVPRSIR